MYSLKEAWVKMQGSLPFEGWEGRLYCNHTDAAITYRANITQGFMAAYTFTLVNRGWLTFIYNGRELTLHENDLYIYSPGLSVTILAASEDYQGICLLADEPTTLETPAFQSLVQVAYHPIVQMSEPKLSLPDDTAGPIRKRMEEIKEYLHSDKSGRSEILKHLYAIFLLELQNAQEQSILATPVSKRIEELFIRFVRLLPQHCAAHHDIGFYASRMNITTTYLSRLVRKVSGRTVVAYINQFLALEATFLLKTTTLSVSQIADRLHFADIASFSRFFFRITGVSPKRYRG
ncbi:MAG: helix-turn-helix transcriptional regulator [Bacteroidales bacterium]|nr:helix-turn-helix transcriptional regulator [Bacteroidales bacterium]